MFSFCSAHKGKKKTNVTWKIWFHTWKYFFSGEIFLLKFYFHLVWHWKILLFFSLLTSFSFSFDFTQRNTITENNFSLWTASLSLTHGKQGKKMDLKNFLLKTQEKINNLRLCVWKINERKNSRRINLPTLFFIFKISGQKFSCENFSRSFLADFYLFFLK